jgi:2',3'-cyclic-nucleotide 2'-phosphodiesterase (5'-nucleotidase family)
MRPIRFSWVDKWNAGCFDAVVQHYTDAMRLRFLPLLLILIAAFAGVWLPAQSYTHIVIVHTNDIHGQLTPRAGVGGVAELATAIHSQHPDLILDAGDIFTGTFMSDNFSGAPTIQAMNKIGYNAGTIGNHEFDYGQPALHLRLREAKFPVLSANLDTPIPEIKKYTVLTVKGIRFGIIGLTTEELKTTTHPKNLTGVTVHDIVETVRQILPEVRRRSDFIIVTAHIDRPEQKRIADAFPEIRLIITGHDHGELGPVWYGQTLAAATGSNLRNVGRVDLVFSNKKLSQMDAKLIPLVQFPPDPEIARILGPYQAKVAAKMNEVLGQATGDFARSSNSESSLGNLIADVYREKGNTDIGIQNTGGIRAQIPTGRITWGSIFEVLPFQNTLVTLKLSGAQLKRTLNSGLLAVSGLRVEYDRNQPEGRQLISVTLADGSPVQDDKFYTVTTNDFLVAGGDGFVEFGKGSDIKDSGILLRDVLADHVKAHPVLSPKTDGRIVVR